MHFKTIKKSIDIGSSAEKVWEVLFTPASYEIWAATFSEGAQVETDWQEGSKVIFTDSTNSGLVGTIERNIHSEFLSIIYTGFVQAGVEDLESEKAKQMKGAKETYSLSPKNGGTHLVIECDMDESYKDMMSGMWDKTLLKIKELSDTQQEV